MTLRMHNTGESAGYTISPKTPGPTIPTRRNKEETEKTVNEKRGASSLDQ